jgi:lysophospholipase L1-like esterase
VGNFGVGGTTVLLNTETPYMHTSAYKDALAFQPDIVIIMLGTNDAQPNLKQYNASFVGDYVKLINSFKALESKPEIWIVLPPPIFSNQSGRMDPVYFTNTIIPDIRQAANQTNLPIINVYSALEDHPNYFTDGLHPNRSGAELIANEIYNSIS